MEQAAYDATLWRLTLQHSPIGMMLVDLDGRLTMVNRAACTMLGRDADDLRACTFQELTHPDDLDTDLTQFERTLAGEIDATGSSSATCARTGACVGRPVRGARA